MNRGYHHSTGSTCGTEESLWEKQITHSLALNSTAVGDTEVLPSVEGRPLGWRASQVCLRGLTLFETELVEVPKNIIKNNGNLPEGMRWRWGLHGGGQRRDMESSVIVSTIKIKLKAMVILEISN